MEAHPAGGGGAPVLPNGYLQLRRVLESYDHLRTTIDTALPSIPEIVSKPSPLPPLQIVIAGAVNSGKSTLINALLGREVLPWGSIKCTSRITVLRKSPDNQFHIKMNETTQHFGTVEDLVEQLEQLAGGAQQDTNMTEVVVEFVGSHLLDQGLQIVDTPGFNESPAIREASLEFIRRAVVVLFLISRDDGSLVTENTSALQFLAAATILPIFIMTKVDTNPNPILYGTPARRRRYEGDTNRMIAEVREGIARIYPNRAFSFFPLSAIEALIELSNRRPYPQPFQDLLANLGSSLHRSLLVTVLNSFTDYTPRVSTLLTQFISIEHIQRAITSLDKLITDINHYKDKKKRELTEKLQKEFDSFINSNRNNLVSTLSTCTIPPSDKAQARQYLLLVLHNTLLNHLQSTASSFYKEYLSFLQNLREDKEDQPVHSPSPDVNPQDNPLETISKWSMIIGSLIFTVLPNAIGTPQAILVAGVSAGSLFASGGALFLAGGLAMIAARLTKENIDDPTVRKTLATAMLQSEDLKPLRDHLLKHFEETYEKEVNQFLQTLSATKTARQDTLSTEKRELILKHAPDITRTYVKLTAARSRFQFEEPSIDYTAVFPGNSRGVIYQATFQGEPFYAQVFGGDYELSFNYINSLGEHYLIDLPDGKRAILRKALWGSLDGIVSTEGVQKGLNGWLPVGGVDEGMLIGSLVEAFKRHGWSDKAATIEVKRLIKEAIEYVNRINLNDVVVRERFINGRVPTVIECASVTAYTMESDLYKFINQDLRTPNRNPSSLKHWAPFLSLLLKALNCMKPVTTGKVYRGLRGLIDNYETTLSPERDCIYWYTITSASKKKQVAVDFASGVSDRMLFKISVCHAYSVAWLSTIASEDELLFVPGCRFKTVAVQPIRQQDGFAIIKMRQIPSDLSFLK